MNMIWREVEQKQFENLPPLIPSEQTRLHRRNLLVALAVIFLYVGAGIVPKDVHAAFVAGTVRRPFMIELALWAVVIYEVLMYHATLLHDEIQHVSANAKFEEFKKALNQRLMFSAFAKHYMQPTVELVDSGITPVGDFAIYRLVSLRYFAVNGFESKDAEALTDQQRLEYAKRIPNIQWEKPYPGMFRFDNREEISNKKSYFKVAFPRIRRLTFLSFLQYRLPYVLFFLAAIGKVALVVFIAPS